MYDRAVHRNTRCLSSSLLKETLILSWVSYQAFTPVSIQYSIFCSKLVHLWPKVRCYRLQHPAILTRKMMENGWMDILQLNQWIPVELDHGICSGGYSHICISHVELNRWPIESLKAGSLMSVSLHRRLLEKLIVPKQTLSFYRSVSLRWDYVQSWERCDSGGESSPVYNGIKGSLESYCDRLSLLSE